MKIHRLLAVALLICGIANTPADIWQDLRTYKMGDESNAPGALEDLARQTSPSEYAAIESALLNLLKDESATEDGKRYACRMLQRVGSKKSVSVLGDYLDHKVLSHYARIALQEMDYATVDKTLRSGLAKAPNSLKPGILGTIGERGDVNAVNDITTLISSDNIQVANAAFLALGRIGGDQAADALISSRSTKQTQPAHLEALVNVADSLSNNEKATAIYRGVYRSKSEVFQVAALRGLIHTDAHNAAGMLVELVKSNDSYLRRGAMRLLVMEQESHVTGDVAGAIESLGKKQQIEVIDLLGERGDTVALKSITPYLKNKDPELRSVSVSAIGKLGNASHAELLINAGGDEATAALVSMTDPKVDQALVKLLDGRSTQAAIKVLAARGNRSVAPQVLNVLQSANAEARKEAWTALATLASVNEMRAMMEAAIKIKDQEERNHAENAVKRFCGSSNDKEAAFKVALPFFENAPESTQRLILELASVAGSKEALRLAQQTLKTGNADAKTTALRTLTDWPNLDASQDLLDLANNAPDKVARLLALRGYIRIVGLDSNGASANKRVKMYETAYGIAERPDEKRLIAAGLRRVKNPKALEMLGELINDETIKTEAELAAIDLAWDMRRQHPALVAALSKRVMDTSKNDNVVKKATQAYNQTKDKK